MLEKSRDSAFPSSTSHMVSVVIPTFRARTTIANCLNSTLAACPPDSEIIVVDSLSDDGTAELAKGIATVISAPSSMTRARCIGTLAATGTYILHLDADQTLARDSINRCLATGKDAVVLGEESLGTGVVARINRLDKRLSQEKWAENLASKGGPLVPRFYRRACYLKALQRLPAPIIDQKPSQPHEDALLFRLSGIAPRSVGFVEHAIFHYEVPSVRRYIAKWYERGRTAGNGKNREVDWIIRTQGGRGGGIAIGIGSLPARALRGLPFYFGYGLAHHSGGGESV